MPAGHGSTARKPRPCARGSAIHPGERRRLQCRPGPHVASPGALSHRVRHRRRRHVDPQGFRGKPGNSRGRRRAGIPSPGLSPASAELGARGLTHRHGFCSWAMAACAVAGAPGVRAIRGRLPAPATAHQSSCRKQRAWPSGRGRFARLKRREGREETDSMQGEIMNAEQVCTTQRPVWRAGEEECTITSFPRARPVAAP